MPTTIRNANLGDLSGIKNLYLDITEKYPDNLTPFTNEVTDEFIYEGLQAALERGGALVMENENKEIIGYSKGITSQNIRKAHILDNTTIIVRSDYMGSMIVHRFCRTLFNEIKRTMPHIKYSRSVPHIINDRSLKLLQSIGMKQVARQPNAIMCKDGSFVDEVTLIWENPDFSQQALITYHKYLINKYSTNEKYSMNIYITKESRDSDNVFTSETNSVSLAV